MALVAAGPGWLRDALLAMLVALLPDVIILEADDAAASEALLCQFHPHLVIIDGDLPGLDAMQLVKATHAERPRVRCAILVNSISQQAAALKAGADHAPIKGEPPTRLFGQVEQLLALH